MIDKWLMIVTLALTTSSALAAGKVISITGKAKIIQSTKTKELELKFSDLVQPGDTILTGKDDKVKIMFEADQSMITIGPSSRLIISTQLYDEPKKSRTTILKLLKGKVRSLVPKLRGFAHSQYEVQTPNAVAGVRGTDFLTWVTDDGTEVITFEGEVTVKLPHGPVIEVPANFGFKTKAGPVKPQPNLIDPKQLKALDQDTTVHEDPVPPMGGNLLPPPWMNPEHNFTLPPLPPPGPPGMDPFTGAFFGNAPLGPNGPPPADFQSALGSAPATPVDINIDTSNLPRSGAGQ